MRKTIFITGALLWTIQPMREFFTLNRPLLLFVYGQTYFVMGLAIFLHSRRHSRLRLARDLRWLAAFGVLHGLHEWGDVFIPIQAQYLPAAYIQILLTLQAVLLAISFTCLMIFGAVALEQRWQRSGQVVIGVAVAWGIFALIMFNIMPTFDSWYTLTSIGTRYVLGFPGALLAAYGLRYQARVNVKPLGVDSIYRTLRIAGLMLLAYAFFGGLIVPTGPFFPANVLNREALVNLIGIPVEVFRSLTGLIMAIAMIRALEIFDIELDRLIAVMEVEQIQNAERDKIGQEIHDGAIQGVYSAGLILETMQPYLETEEAKIRLDRVKRVLNDVITDLRRYMMSLRTSVPTESLLAGIQRMANDPRFSSLMTIHVDAQADPQLKPTQVGYTLAIVQEALSNAIRHANASKMSIQLSQQPQGLLIKCEDNGRGFDETTSVPGFGLRAMRDRTRLLGGELTVQSKPGKGTTITLFIPEENNRHDHATHSTG